MGNNSEAKDIIRLFYKKTDFILSNIRIHTEVLAPHFDLSSMPLPLTLKI